MSGAARHESLPLVTGPSGEASLSGKRAAEKVPQTQYEGYRTVCAHSDMEQGDTPIDPSDSQSDPYLIHRALSNSTASELRSNTKGEEDSDTEVLVLSREAGLPIYDIEQFVNRSNEIRQQEVESRKGYRPRPMNNFMLYRKTYQERAKRVSNQKCHQVVSRIVGNSWKKESPEVKMKYTEYAQIEKDNQILAFPDYKYRPDKPKKASKKTTDFATDELTFTDDEGSNDVNWSKNSTAKTSHPVPNHFEQPDTLSCRESPGSQNALPIHGQNEHIRYHRLVSPPPSNPLPFDSCPWVPVATPGENVGSLPSYTGSLSQARDAFYGFDDFGSVLHQAPLTSQLEPHDPFAWKLSENLNAIASEYGWEEAFGSPAL